MTHGDPTEVRLDKWLWAVRIFKTRGLALDACKAGHVKAEGRNLKPAHLVRAGEVYEVQRGERALKLRVTRLIDRRGGAAVAMECVEDLSPPPPPPRATDGAPSLPDREPGSGRPTKKERRLMDAFFDPLIEE